MMEINTDIQKEEVSFEWEAPKSHSLSTSTTLLKKWKLRFLRTFLIMFVVMAILYPLVRSLPLQEIDFDLNAAFLLVMLFALVSCFLCYVVGPYAERFNIIKYKVDSKGITIRSSSVRFYHWKHITGCCPLESDETMNGVHIVIFNTKKTLYPNRLVFDENQKEIAEKICQYITEKAAQHHGNISEKPRLQLTLNQHWYMFAVSLVGAFVVTSSVLPWWVEHAKDSGPIMALSPLWALIVILCFGPGTWGLVTLFGKKLFQYKNWFQCAYVYNVIALILIKVFAFVYGILILRESFEGY